MAKEIITTPDAPGHAAYGKFPYSQAVKAVGSSMDRVVNATFILRFADDFAGMNEEWLRWFPVDPPARQGSKHPLDSDSLRISIAVIAEA